MKVLIPILFLVGVSLQVQSLEMGSGIQDMGHLQTGFSAANAALNAKEANKNKKKCKAGDQSACTKATAHMGQMLQSLAQMMGSMLTQVSAAPDSSSGSAGFDSSDYKNSSYTPKELQSLESGANDPIAALEDEAFAEQILSKEGTKLTSQQRRDILDAVNYAADAKVDIDEATGKITSTDGTVSLASLSSPTGMKGLGFSENEIQNLLKKHEAIASEFAGALKSANAGAGGGAAARPKPKGGNFDFNYKSAFGSSDYGVKSVLGDRSDRVWSRSFGGEPIGIKQGDIFKMISTRYRKKIAEMNFLP